MDPAHHYMAKSEAQAALARIKSVAEATVARLA